MASGVSMVDTDASGIKQMSPWHLKEGNVVAIASDQVPKKGGRLLSIVSLNQECLFNDSVT